MEKVGRYQIREIIGEGAMARVYKAYDPEIDRTLAIKLLKSQLRGDAEYRMRFLREAKGAGVLSHPNIVTVFDVGDDDGHPYIAMELVEGPTLADLVQEREAAAGQGQSSRSASSSRARSTTRTSKGIVHRDVKPGNIMLVNDTQHGEGRRLRHLPHRQQRSHAGHAGRQRARHAELHVARAGAGREGRFALRPLLRRRRALPAADRASAVRGRHADQRRLQDHQDRAAVARQAASRHPAQRCAASSSARSRSSRTSASRPARSSRRR